MIPIEVLALLVLFVLDAYFSAAEIAMSSLSRYKLDAMAVKHPSFATLLLGFKINPSRLLTTILVSSNLTVIAFSSTATALGLTLSEGSGLPSLWVGSLTLLLSAMTILVAEIAPKVVAKRHPERVAELVIPGLRLTEFALGPFIRLIVAFISWLTRPFGGGAQGELPQVSEEELVHMLDEGTRGGVIDREEGEMIQSVLEFGDTLVRQVMVPRANMDAVPVDASVEFCREKFIECGYSRLPVYEGTPDHIVGILYAKDFLALWQMSDLVILRDVLRQPHFVPETKAIAELLREFKKGRMHIAIVVDEFGGTAGLVTLEDLVEEIVGEIKDEYDLEPSAIRKTAEGQWEADGALGLEDLEAATGFRPPEDADFGTLGGWLANKTGRIPRMGERFSEQGIEFEISAATATLVERVKMRKIAGTV